MNRISLVEFHKLIISGTELMQPALICIDGLGGSGKSVLSDRLARFDTSIRVVRMDDFYLPSEYRYSQTCAEINMPAGRNFDLKRLEKQVIIPFKSREVVKYQKYDWIKDTLGEWCNVNLSTILIIEGVYSSSKLLNKYYDKKIWVECSQEIRLKRGLERDGESTKELWLNEWMPLEDQYISQQNPMASCDYIIINNDISEDICIVSNDNHP